MNPEPEKTDEPTRATPVLDYRIPVNVDVQSLVTVGSYASDFEANLAAEKLRAEGIRCMLSNENAVIALGTPGASMDGGIKLRVMAGDEELARAALPKHHTEPPPRCPKCHSMQTHATVWPQWARILNYCLIGLPWMFIGIKHQCDKCGNLFLPDPSAWDDEEEKARDDADDDAGERRDEQQTPPG